jgi:hypothetical protein
MNPVRALTDPTQTVRVQDEVAWAAYPTCGNLSVLIQLARIGVTNKLRANYTLHIP